MGRRGDGEEGGWGGGEGGDAVRQERVRGRDRQTVEDGEEREGKGERYANLSITTSNSYYICT